jgi:hypothetical protein
LRTNRGRSHAGSVPGLARSVQSNLNRPHGTLVARSPRGHRASLRVSALPAPCNRNWTPSAWKIYNSSKPPSSPAAAIAGAWPGVPRRYDEAIAGCKKLADENPTYAPAHRCLYLAYWGKRIPASRPHAACPPPSPSSLVHLSGIAAMPTTGRGSSREYWCVGRRAPY